MSQELTDVSKAVAEFDRVAAGLGALQNSYANVVYPVTTTAGMADAKAARAALREPRYEIERVRKAAKAPLLALGKQLDAEAARITRELEALELPIDAQIKEEEQRKEAERQARIDAEVKRVSAIQQKIDHIRAAVAAAVGRSSEDIAEAAAQVEEIVINSAEFAEFLTTAEDAKVATLARLNEMQAAALAHELEQKRIAEERAELARLRADQEKRDAAERERIAEEKRQADAARAEADRLAREKREAEAARVKAEQDARDVELRKRQEEIDGRELARKIDEQAAADRLEDDRRALERREAAVAEAEARANLAKAPKTNKRPSDDEIIKAVAEAFGVSRQTATRWLTELRLAA